MPDSKDEITVTKLDAAQRQLRTAIRLWFGDGDPVSIHTLLSAAHEIIHRLYRNKGLRNLIFDSDLIADEFRGDWARKFKEAPNFFKHASQDSDDTLIFYSGVNGVIPLFLVQALRDMGETLGFEESAYVRWMWTHEPHLFQTHGNPPPLNLVENVKGINKADFFEACELLHSQGGLPAAPLMNRVE
jgi:hypothetical protein